MACIGVAAISLLIFLMASTQVLAQPASARQEPSVAQALPLGVVNQGIRIPSFEESGRKASDLRAATAVRIDDEQLLAHEVWMDWHGKLPSEVMQLHLPSALYNLVTQVVRAAERSKVTRQDLETSADSLVFDSRRSVGRMVGRVRTLFFSPKPQDSTRSR
jgi:hypothetical protein